MNKLQKTERIKRTSDESLILRRSLIAEMSEEIATISDLLAGVIGSGGKIFIAGNGDQGALASQFAAELVLGSRSERTRQPLPAIALSSDATLLTAASNDLGAKEMFVRQLEGLGHKNDLLMLLSDNGEEPNLIRAAQVARDRSIITFALIGRNGGRLKFGVDRPIVIPSNSSQRVIEEQTFILHLLADLIESDLII
ncbi:MAG: SIS domain-containing protein [Candidatus Zixiibacteriota bacterium]